LAAGLGVQFVGVQRVNIDVDQALNYDRIGIDYSQLRKADWRIARMIDAALGAAHTVLNVGAGTGSYEPDSRRVTAVEPSAHMISQRPTTAALCLQGYAEQLPFDNHSFDASMAVLTVHHWTDQARGLSEMRRVTRGPLVILTFDPAFRNNWQLDYWPELASLDEQKMPQLTEYEKALGQIEITPVLIPHDCSDGFLFAYWRRPWAYLDARIRSGMSSFWSIKNAQNGLERLAQDLNSHAWEQRYAALLELEKLDVGYRLVVSPGSQV
jgi:SAM-dependent methyltransferase